MDPSRLPGPRSARGSHKKRRVVPRERPADFALKPVPRDHPRGSSYLALSLRTPQGAGRGVVIDPRRSHRAPEPSGILPTLKRQPEASSPTGGVVGRFGAGVSPPVSV